MMSLGWTTLILAALGIQLLASAFVNAGLQQQHHPAPQPKRGTSNTLSPVARDDSIPPPPRLYGGNPSHASGSSSSVASTSLTTSSLLEEAQDVEIGLRVTLRKENLVEAPSCVHTFAQLELLNLRGNERILIHSISTAPEETIIVHPEYCYEDDDEIDEDDEVFSLPKQLFVSRLPSANGLSLGPGQVAIVPLSFLPLFPDNDEYYEQEEKRIRRQRLMSMNNGERMQSNNNKKNSGRKRRTSGGQRSTEATTDESPSDRPPGQQPPSTSPQQQPLNVSNDEHLSQLKDLEFWLGRNTRLKYSLQQQHSQSYDDRASDTDQPTDGKAKQKRKRRKRRRSNSLYWSSGVEHDDDDDVEEVVTVYKVTTTLIVESDRGQIRMPIEATSVRRNSYGLPNVIQLRTPHDDDDDDEDACGTKSDSTSSDFFSQYQQKQPAGSPSQEPGDSDSGSGGDDTVWRATHRMLQTYPSPTGEGRSGSEGGAPPSSSPLSTSQDRLLRNTDQNLLFTVVANHDCFDIYMKHPLSSDDSGRYTQDLHVHSVSLQPGTDPRMRLQVMDLDDLSRDEQMPTAFEEQQHAESVHDWTSLVVDRSGGLMTLEDLLDEEAGDSDGSSGDDEATVRPRVIPADDQLHYLVTVCTIGSSAHGTAHQGAGSLVTTTAYGHTRTGRPSSGPSKPPSTNTKEEQEFLEDVATYMSPTSQQKNSQHPFSKGYFSIDDGKSDRDSDDDSSDDDDDGDNWLGYLRIQTSMDTLFVGLERRPDKIAVHVNFYYDPDKANAFLERRKRGRYYYDHDDDDDDGCPAVHSDTDESNNELGHFVIVVEEEEDDDDDDAWIVDDDEVENEDVSETPDEDTYSSSTNNGTTDSTLLDDSAPVLSASPDEIHIHLLPSASTPTFRTVPIHITNLRSKNPITLMRVSAIWNVSTSMPPNFDQRIGFSISLPDRDGRRILNHEESNSSKASPHSESVRENAANSVIGFNETLENAFSLECTLDWDKFLKDSAVQSGSYDQVQFQGTVIVRATRRNDIASLQDWEAGIRSDPFYHVDADLVLEIPFRVTLLQGKLGFVVQGTSHPFSVFWMSRPWLEYYRTVAGVFFPMTKKDMRASIENSGGKEPGSTTCSKENDNLLPPEDQARVQLLEDDSFHNLKTMDHHLRVFTNVVVDATVARQNETHLGSSVGATIQIKGVEIVDKSGKPLGSTNSAPLGNTATETAGNKARSSNNKKQGAAATSASASSQNLAGTVNAAGESVCSRFDATFVPNPGENPFESDISDYVDLGLIRLKYKLPTQSLLKTASPSSSAKDKKKNKNDKTKKKEDDKHDGAGKNRAHPTGGTSPLSDENKTDHKRQTADGHDFPPQCNLRLVTEPDTGDHLIPLMVYGGNVHVSDTAVGASKAATSARPANTDDPNSDGMKQSRQPSSVKQGRKFQQESLSDDSSGELTTESSASGPPTMVGFEPVIAWLQHTKTGAALRTVLGSSAEASNRSKNSTSATIPQDNVLIGRYLYGLARKSAHLGENSKLRPVLMQAGAIAQGETETLPLYLTNHNPIPIEVTIDVGEVEGMSISLAREHSTGKGDGINVLDHLPRKPRLKILRESLRIPEPRVKKGPYGGHPINGLRQFLLSDESASSFLTQFPYRDAVSLSPSAVDQAPLLSRLFLSYAVPSFHKSPVPSRFLPGAWNRCSDDSKSSSLQHPPTYGPFEKRPAKTWTSGSGSGGRRLPGPMIISSDGRSARQLPVCWDREGEPKDKQSDGSVLLLPPGGVARFDVNLRSPPNAVLEKDITEFLATGLVLSTNHGEVMPVFIAFEALQGRLDVSHIPSAAESLLSASRRDVIRVPISLFEQPEVVMPSTEAAVRIPPRSSTPGVTIITRNATSNDATGVPLFMRSSFSRDVLLRQVSSCNPWFQVVLRRTTYSDQEDEHRRYWDPYRGVDIGVVSSVATCNDPIDLSSGSSSSQFNLSGHPSFFRCALNWLTNRAELQPRGCGMKESKSSGSADEFGSNGNVGAVGVERAVLSMKRALLIAEKAYGAFHATPVTSRRDTSSSTEVPAAYKTGRRSPDGRLPQALIDAEADAWDALHAVSAIGLLSLSTSLRADIEYNSSASGKIPQKTHVLSVALRNLTVESILEPPKLLRMATEAAIDSLISSEPLSPTASGSRLLPDSGEGDGDNMPILEFPATPVADVSSMTLPVRNPTAAPIRVRLGVASPLSADLVASDPLLKALGVEESVREKFIGELQPPFVQSGKVQPTQGDKSRDHWWDGAGAFYQADFDGDLIRSHHNVSIVAGAFAHISLRLPSLLSSTAFLVGCGPRCGVKDDAKWVRGSEARRQVSPIGASASLGQVLKGRERPTPVDSADSPPDPEALYLLSGSDGPSSFALPFSALDEVVIPPFGQAELGPIMFRPTGRHNLACGATSAGYCRTNVFEASIFLESSMSGLQRVVLRGRALWEKLEFVDPDHAEFSDLEYRNGRTTLVFSGSSGGQGSPSTPSTQPVTKEVVLHNFGELNVSVYAAFLSPTAKLYDSRQSAEKQCEYSGFRVLNCATLTRGFVLSPGTNQSIYVQHTPDCTRREDFVALNLDIGRSSNLQHPTGFRTNESSFTGFNRSSTVRGSFLQLSRNTRRVTIAGQPFRKRRMSLLVGFEMTKDEFSECMPSPSSSLSAFNIFSSTSKRPNDESSFRLLEIDRGSRKSRHIRSRLLNLLVALASVSGGIAVLMQRSRSRIASSSNFDSIIKGGATVLMKGRPHKLSNWGAAFRCLARGDPSSQELLQHGREQVRHFVLARFRSLGVLQPLCLGQTGVFQRERADAVAARMSARQATSGREGSGGGGGSSGGGGERGRTISDSIFRDFRMPSGKPDTGLLPCALNWRTAQARGLLRPRHYRISSSCRTDSLLRYRRKQAELEGALAVAAAAAERQLRQVNEIQPAVATQVNSRNTVFQTSFDSDDDPESQSAPVMPQSGTKNTEVDSQEDTKHQVESSVTRRRCPAEPATNGSNSKSTDRTRRRNSASASKPPKSVTNSASDAAVKESRQPVASATTTSSSMVGSLASEAKAVLVTTNKQVKEGAETTPAKENATQPTKKQSVNKQGKRAGSKKPPASSSPVSIVTENSKSGRGMSSPQAVDSKPGSKSRRKGKDKDTPEKGSAAANDSALTTPSKPASNKSSTSRASDTGSTKKARDNDTPATRKERKKRQDRNKKGSPPKEETSLQNSSKNAAGTDQDLKPTTSGNATPVKKLDTNEITTPLRPPPGLAPPPGFDTAGASDPPELDLAAAAASSILADPTTTAASSLSGSANKASAMLNTPFNSPQTTAKLFDRTRSADSSDMSMSASPRMAPINPQQSLDDLPPRSLYDDGGFTSLYHELPAVTTPETNGFDVLDFLDGILNDGGAGAFPGADQEDESNHGAVGEALGDDPPLDGTGNASLPLFGDSTWGSPSLYDNAATSTSSGVVDLVDNVNERQSRLSAYGISMEDGSDRLEESLNLPLLTPSAILDSEVTESNDRELQVEEAADSFFVNFLQD